MNDEKADDYIDSIVKNILHVAPEQVGFLSHKNEEESMNETTKDINDIVRNFLNVQPMQIVPLLKDDNSARSSHCSREDLQKIDGFTLEQSAIFDESLAHSVELEFIIKQCGEFGRFQCTHFFLLTLLATCSGVASFYHVFGTAVPQHRCQLPQHLWANDQFQVHNETHKNYIDQWTPKDVSSNCFTYNASFENRSIVNCHKWLYDRTVYGYTFTEEHNLVCSNSTKRTLLAAAFSFGLMFVIITGGLADCFGRKKAITLVFCLFAIVSIITQIALQLRILKEKYQFILLFMNQIFTGVACTYFICAYVLIMELSSLKYSGLGACLFLVGNIVGEIIVTFLAWVIKDWLLLKWFITGYILLLSLSYVYFIPESPRWLYSQQNWSELESLLSRIAKTNGRKNETWLPLYPTVVTARKLFSSNTFADEQTTSCMKQSYPLLTTRDAIKRLYELHPTMFRVTSLAIVEFMSRAGTLIAPIIDKTNSSTNQRMLVYIYATATVIAAIFAFTLPETKGKPLPGSFDEIQGWKTKKLLQAFY
ncbi:unnamed protein product [Didymodactylos carnosus]|uniref:Major facilitator superfamily (MFS) profile domain-containing protein n=1 Tax=Didymodactylos carnosus TaxID=1234261 RepID=A0A813VG99_9BILA|nr:unnamed protein product [Didymodactylos carnosus]CAF3624500.1 unnamed protein product [Didymodactylos carnosus]